MPSDPHAPAELRHYLRAHEAHMDQLRRSGFVGADTLAFEAVSGVLKLEGEISCKGRILVTVFKLIGVLDAPAEAALAGDDHALVQTFRYSYNASIQGFGNLLRHDNAHPHPGHPSPHHVHRFDWKTNDELPGSPDCCGADGWPTLGEFVRTLEHWHAAHYGDLPEPDAFAELGRREPD